MPYYKNHYVLCIFLYESICISEVNNLNLVSFHNKLSLSSVNAFSATIYGFFIWGSWGSYEWLKNISRCYTGYYSHVAQKRPLILGDT